MMVKRENNQFFAADRADVGVEAADFVPGDRLYYGFKVGAAGFDQFGAHLFNEVPRTAVAVGFNKPELGFGENPLEPHNDHVVDQVGPGLQRPASHVFLFEPGDRFADLRFHLAFG
jgi:hypothetical protein